MWPKFLRLHGEGSRGLKRRALMTHDHLPAPPHCCFSAEGNLEELQRLWLVCFDDGEESLRLLSKTRNNWADLRVGFANKEHHHHHHQDRRPSHNLQEGVTAFATSCAASLRGAHSDDDADSDDDVYMA